MDRFFDWAFRKNRIRANQQERPEPIQLETDSTFPDPKDFRELEEDGTFEENQIATLAIHREELPTLIQNPTVAIVKRAYCELQNGNLTHQLDSLSDLRIDAKEIECMIVVNNPRIIAIIAELFSGTPDIQPAQAVETIQKYYVHSSLKLSKYEQDFLFALVEGKKSIRECLTAYRENQMTLQILATIRNAVLVALTNETSGEDQFYTLEEELIKQMGGSLDVDQSRLLIDAAKKVLKRKLLILGIDCSTAHKAYHRVDLGQATNQGSHIAYSRGAQYIDISDMDEFYPRQSFAEILQLSVKDPPDVLYRPLRVVTPQHPEQLRTPQWNDLVYYYASSALRSWRSLQYAYHRPHLDRNKVHNSGKIILSREAFKKHQYPHGDTTEDLEFSRSLQEDLDLRHHQLLNEELMLSDRGREGSYDGGKLGDRIGNWRTLNDLRKYLEEWSDDEIRSLLSTEGQILESLKDSSFSVRLQETLIQVYEKAKHRFWIEENKKRRMLRLIFLSERGLIRTLSPLLLSQDRGELGALDKLNLSSAQKTFLKNNPMLLPALQMEVQTRNFKTPEEVCSFIEKSLPELFSRPLWRFSNEHSEDPMGLDTYDSKNISLWIHIYRARQWLASYLLNELHSDQKSEKEKKEIRDLVYILTR